MSCSAPVAASASKIHWTINFWWGSVFLVNLPGMVLLLVLGMQAAAVTGAALLLASAAPAGASLRAIRVRETEG